MSQSKSTSDMQRNPAAKLQNTDEINQLNHQMSQANLRPPKQIINKMVL